MTYTSYVKVTAQLGASLGIVSSLFYAKYLSMTSMRESPVDAAKHRSSKSTNNPIIDLATMESLKQQGIVIIDNVLSADELDAAQQDLKLMLKNKTFENTDQHSEEIRTDSICFISEPIANQSVTLGHGMRDALRIVRSIPLQLIAHGFEEKLFGVPFANQLSCYNSAGSHYHAHRDTPDATSNHPLKWLLQAGLNEREITIILYLNEIDWDCGCTDDGCLRCYIGTAAEDDTGRSAKEVLNIAPRGGRLVIFDSKTILHEVRPCSKQRAAITCWVGGQHSLYSYLRPLCIPYDELKFS
jgi:hypothetical protein